MKKQKRQLPVISTVVILILFVGESSPSTDVLQERLSIQSKYIRDSPTSFGWKVFFVKISNPSETKILKKKNRQIEGKLLG